MVSLPFGTSSLLIWLMQTTICISVLTCLILAVRVVSRQKLPAWWYYAIWLLLLVRMLSPWALESRFSVFNYVPDLVDDGLNMSALMEYDLFGSMPVGLDLSNGGTGSYGGDPSVNSSLLDLPISRSLPFAWLAGIVVLGVIILVKNLAFWLAVRRKPPLGDDDVLTLLEQAKGLMGSGETSSSWRQEMSRARPCLVISSPDGYCLKAYAIDLGGRSCITSSSMNWGM